MTTVQRHRFDPVSGALGVLAVALGILVMTGDIGSFDVNGGWWLALAAVVVGVALIPWRATGRTAAQPPAAPSEPGDQPSPDAPA